MISKRTSKIFRGIAILMVISSHYAGWMITSPQMPKLREFVGGLGVFGVDIFFLLSGYGLVKSVSKSGVTGLFLWNRIRACYLPYLIIVGVISLWNKELNSGRDVWNYLTGLHYWYIYVQMVLYVLFAVSFVMKKTKEIILTICVCIFTYWLFAIGRADFWELSNAAFLIGVYLATGEKYIDAWIEKKGRKRMLTVLFAVAIMAFLFFHICFERTQLLRWEMLRSIAFTVIIVFLGAVVDFSSVLLTMLGKYSLYIYLVQGFIFWKLIYGYEKFGYLLTVLFIGLVTCLIGVSVGFVFERLVEYMDTMIYKTRRRSS